MCRSKYLIITLQSILKYFEVNFEVKKENYYGWGNSSRGVQSAWDFKDQI